MKINNVRPETSIGAISVIGFLFLFFLQISVEAFNPMLFEKEYFLLIFLSIATIGLGIGFIAAIIHRNKILNQMKCELELKSVEFLKDRICFNFFQPQYNFACGYSDIESLELKIETAIYHAKGGSYTAIREIGLIFQLLNNKKFDLYNVSLSPMKTIYKIIDYSRKIQNFSYKFFGENNTELFKEKVDNYYRIGKKLIYSSKHENDIKAASIISFIGALAGLIIFREVIFTHLSLALFPFWGILILSFIFDITLLINEKRKAFNE